MPIDYTNLRCFDIQGENIVTNADTRKKKFVLALDVLGRDSNAILSFQENDVYIPSAVVEGLDYPNISSESAQSAKEASELLTQLLNGSTGKPAAGIQLPPHLKDSRKRQSGMLFFQDESFPAIENG